MRTLFLLFLIVFSALEIPAQTSQTQTIKVAKNKTMTGSNSSIVPGTLAPVFYTGYSYSCKRIKDMGIHAGLSFPMKMNFVLNLEVVNLAKRYELSAFNPAKNSTAEYISQSATKLIYLKLLFGYYVPLGRKTNFTFGIAPEKLLKMSNENNRLVRDDFYEMNLAYFASVGYRVYRPKWESKLWPPWYIGLRFMGDLNPNLKDEGIYDNTGNLLHKQNSKNYVIELEFSCLFGGRI